MIISASRRTDIPAYYSDWLCNRIKERFVLVRNPMNYHQVSKISLSPEVVDAIVFWTKNPIPMLDRLKELQDYMFCFQFTVTPYGKDVESNLPIKNEILSAFKRLSDAIGADRVIWRYDPILINRKYTFDYHVNTFGKIADELNGYTTKVTISFIDESYRMVKKNIKELALQEITPEIQIRLASELAFISHSRGFAIDTCAEQLDLTQFGIEHARCIDGRLLAKLLKCNLNAVKDKTQRPGCGCAASIDIGMYNTCLNGCLYCYANYNRNSVDGNYERHNPLSPLLSGDIGKEDKIKDREVK